MPHVVEIEEEKQPFLSESNGDLNALSAENGNDKFHNLNHLHHLNSINHHDKDCDTKGSNSLNNYSSSPSKSDQSARDARSQYIMKVATAVFYAVASFLITVVNKIVLTSYK